MSKKGMLVAALAVCVTLSGHADVMLSNFEDNGTDGWQSWGGNGMSTVAAPTASLGSYSLLEIVTNQYWGQLTLPNWANGGVTVANLNAGAQVSLDLFFPSAGWTVDHADVKLEVQTGIGGTQTKDTTVTTTLNALTKDSVAHLTFDLSALGTPLDPASGWVNVALYVQPSYDWTWDSINNPSATAYTPQQVYIDNIQITTAPVPEPSTAAAMVAGGASLWFLLRRRR